MVKLRPWIVALLAFLASCGSSSATSTPAHPTTVGGGGTCGPVKATTLASSAQARVYSLNQTVFGCSVAQGRSFRLGHATRSIRESRVGPVAVAGDLAAYAVTRFGVDTVMADVVVRRLTDGALLRDRSATSRVGPESFQSVGSVVLKADGAVAWIGSQTSIIGRGRGIIQVHAASGSSDAVLDSGAGIDPSSLRVNGSTLTWRHGGLTRHATLR